MRLDRLRPPRRKRPRPRRTPCPRKLFRGHQSHRPFLRRFGNLVDAKVGVCRNCFASAPFKGGTACPCSSRVTASVFESLETLCFSGDFHTPQKNPHFSSLFCDFALRSAIPLAIVLCGPSFPNEKQG